MSNMFKDFQNFFEDSSKKVNEFVSNFSSGIPAGDMVSKFYKQVIEQSQEMMQKMFQQDIYERMRKDLESYQKDMMDKVSDLSKDMGDLPKMQKKIESLVTEGNKKFMDIASRAFQDAYERFNKELKDTMQKLDFSKFFSMSGGGSSKKSASSAGGGASAKSSS